MITLSGTAPTGQFVVSDTMVLNNTPQAEAELERRAAECERFAALFNSRHKTTKAKRSSRKAPQFILRTKPAQ